MPTGYTRQLMEKGQTFEEFVLLCARAIGVFVSMRDDPMDAPIPDKFEPIDHYSNELEQNKLLVERLEQMTHEQRVEYGRNQIRGDLARYRQLIQKAAEENARLDEMGAKVKAWNPPTPDHTDLQKFMLEQIQRSRNDGDYYNKALVKATETSPLALWHSALSEARRQIAYCVEEQQNEIDRANSKTDWVKQLRDSLKGAE